MEVRPDGWPKRLIDCRGLKVRTKRPIANAVGIIPAGTIMTVCRPSRWNAIPLAAPPCPHCGIEPFITGVHPDDLEVL